MKIISKGLASTIYLAYAKHIVLFHYISFYPSVQYNKHYCYIFIVINLIISLFNFSLHVTIAFIRAIDIKNYQQRVKMLYFYGNVAHPHYFNLASPLVIPIPNHTTDPIG